MNELLNNGLLIPEWTTPLGKVTQPIKYGRGIGLKTTLTPEIATQIAADYYETLPAERLSYPQLAKKYGIGRSTVTRLLKEYWESHQIKSSLHSKETLQG